jgi:hypothetical protein
MADIFDTYPGSDDIFIIHKEDALANVMLLPVGEREVRSGLLTSDQAPSRQRDPIGSE